jgi:excisionase family DNA binding protein
MSRTKHRHQHTSATSVAAVMRTPMLADVLNPVASAVGGAVAREVTKLAHNNPRFLKTVGGEVQATGPGAKELRAHMTVLVAEVLEESLCSRTAEGKALRMALIAKLAQAEISGLHAKAARASTPSCNALLTTSEAAVELEVSRPYVSMLCDAGKLGEVVMTEGGHRRIRSSALHAYRARQHEAAMTPREAGVEAGLYDQSDGHFVNVVRKMASVKSANASVSERIRKRRA